MTAITLTSEALSKMEESVTELLEICYLNAVGVRRDHLMAVRWLFGLKPQHIGSAATAAELEDRADYLLDICQPMDHLFLALGQDASASLKGGIDTDEFDQVVTRAIDGYAEGLLRGRAERMRARTQREEADDFV